MFESEIIRKREESRRRAEQHATNINKVLYENKYMEEKKRQDFYTKKALAEQRKAEIDAANEEERELRHQEEMEKEARRRQVRII
jgi:hypothetical protein